jgi:hypothetical protein
VVVAAPLPSGVVVVGMVVVGDTVVVVATVFTGVVGGDDVEHPAPIAMIRTAGRTKRLATIGCTSVSVAPAVSRGRPVEPPSEDQTGRTLRVRPVRDVLRHPNAERVGFEPTVSVSPHLLSREARSTRLRHLSKL